MLALIKKQICATNEKKKQMKRLICKMETVKTNTPDQKQKQKTVLTYQEL